jgi:5'-3' exonuclease
MLKTLVVDGNSVLQTGFHGVKDFYHNDKHFGAIFYFLNTLKKNLEKEPYDKVVVFWDGKKNYKYRRDLYPPYKVKDKKRLDKDKVDDMFRQKNRISQYLEEFFVRQGGYGSCEADDCISYYCKHSPQESKTVLTNDKDLLQLVDQITTVYLTHTDTLVTYEDKIKIGKLPLMIPPCNIPTFKILLGDRSDNIKGIMYFGEKSLIKHFPEIEIGRVSIEEILNKTRGILSTGNKDRGLKNLSEGVSSDGRKGEDFFEVNEKIIDLTNTFLTEEAKTDIIDLINEPLDPEGREKENVVQMMKEDGLFTVLPKKDDSWTSFIHPLIQLRNKEINYFKIQKN